MAQFSATSAFAAGFRLIGRAPLAPLVWGALAALAVLPVQFIQLQVFWPAALRMYGQMIEASRSGHALSPAALQQPPTMVGLTLIFLPITLVIWSVIAAAGMRAVMTPEEKRFFYLRIGLRELWLFLVILVQIVLFYLTVIVMALVFALVVAILTVGAAATHSPPLIIVAALLGVGGGIAGALGVLWLMMRFSLAGPMTVHDGKFRLVESWSLTRGHGWKLVGLALLIWISLFIFEIVFFGLAAGIGAAFGLANLGRLQAALESPETWLGTAMPLIMIGLGIFTIAGGYFWALMIAPFADAYQQIAGPQRMEEAF